ncbi:uncharacterized protein LOC107983260 [Anolis carolinensis]|uniref:uncharacterized protein LOC107983260 n=1 Tax=Anolis carolinensis TaxID=28377 RepID=UPI002F2B5C09
MSWFKGLPGAESAVDKGHRYNISYPNTFLSSGEGSLIITNVSLEDTGRYTCKMMVWGLGEVRGNGINLQVYDSYASDLNTDPNTICNQRHGRCLDNSYPATEVVSGHVIGNNFLLLPTARPSHPIIFLQIQTEPKPSWTLVCRTHGFYPASVQLTWYLSRQKLPSSQQNWTDPAGFHQASSFLDLPYPHQKTSYTCNLEHPSLIGPINVQYFYEPQLQSCLTSSSIEILNLLKIGTIFSITIGFLAPVCVGFCKKHPGRSPIAHFTGSQRILDSHTKGVF